MRSAKLLDQSSRWAVITEFAQAASTTCARPLRAANDPKLGHSHHGGCRGHLRVHLNRRRLARFWASHLLWFAKSGVDFERQGNRWAQRSDHPNWSGQGSRHGNASLTHGASLLMRRLRLLIMFSNEVGAKSEPRLIQWSPDAARNLQAPAEQKSSSSQQLPEVCRVAPIDLVTGGAIGVSTLHGRRHCADRRRRIRALHKHRGNLERESRRNGC